MGILGRVVTDERCGAVPGERYAMAAISRSAGPTQVIIVGGGFAGIEVASQLGRLLKGNDAVNVILVSSENYFLFQPLLPEVVACSVEPSHILNPIRQLCRHIQYRWGTVETIDLQAQQVTILGDEAAMPQHISYDHLVLCLGQVIGSSAVPGMRAVMWL